MDYHIRRELAHLKALETEAWKAWESKHDPRFLEQVKGAIVTRMKLLGLEKGIQDLADAVRMSRIYYIMDGKTPEELDVITQSDIEAEDDNGRV